MAMPTQRHDLGARQASSPASGHEEPWTTLSVTDGAGAAVAWGSHPMGAAAKLPLDAIAVRAPAVLHLAFPAGTTAFRIQARADPVYAKNGSMQAVPFDHPPSADQLHFDVMRYLIGAPKSTRQRIILGVDVQVRDPQCSSATSIQRLRWRRGALFRSIR